jgi:hypothetical protein
MTQPMGARATGALSFEWCSSSASGQASGQARAALPHQLAAFWRLSRRRFHPQQLFQLRQRALFLEH